MGFQAFDPRDLVISSDNVTSTVWTNGSPELTAFYTSSVQAASNTGKYYLNIFEGSAATGSSEFAIAYCDVKGSGSEYYNAAVTGYSPTLTNFGQYRTLVLGDEEASFVFGNFSSSYFYALPVERAGFKEKLLPGVMSLKLSGSGGEITLTDDSELGGAAVFTDAGRRYNLVSGSEGTVYTGLESNGWTPNSGSYGWFLPDVGLILLNGEALDGDDVDTNGGIDLGTERSANTDDENPNKIFEALKLGESFQLNSSETLSSDFVFVRARNDEFNFSTNPSFISGSTGEVLYNSFINDPQVYITTVGLYNDNQELLAVAKLSRPLLKDFTKELLVRVKLDF